MCCTEDFPFCPRPERYFSLHLECEMVDFFFSINCRNESRCSVRNYTSSEARQAQSRIFAVFATALPSCQRAAVVICSNDNSMDDVKQHLVCILLMLLHAGRSLLGLLWNLTHTQALRPWTAVLLLEHSYNSPARVILTLNIENSIRFEIRPALDCIGPSGEFLKPIFANFAFLGRYWPFSQKAPTRWFKNHTFWNWDTKTVTKSIELEVDLFSNLGSAERQCAPL